jgi:hypothetical protein
LEEEEEIIFRPAKVSFQAAGTTDEYPDDDFDEIFEEAEKEAGPTPSQLIGSALNTKQQESITADSDAMEDDDHETVYVGDLKLNQNQYHAVRNHKSPKKSTKTDAPSDSPDFTGHPSSGQNSGNAVDHHHAAPSNDASGTQVLAGSGD